MLVKHSCYNILLKSWHKEAIKYSKDNKQTKLLFPASQEGQSASTASAAKTTGLVNLGDDSLKMEMYWLAKKCI